MIKNFFKSLGYGVIVVIFPVIASIIIQLNNITSDNLTYAIQSLFFGLAAILGFLILKKQNNLRILKYNNDISSKKNIFLPIVFIELITLVTGIILKESIFYYTILLLFTIFVGISEEIFFRGIILSILKTKNI